MPGHPMDLAPAPIAPIRKLPPKPALQLPAPAVEKPKEPTIYSEEAELCVLGSMLIDPEAAQIALEMVDIEDFYLGKHRSIFRVLHERASAGEVLDEVLVGDDLARAGALEHAGGREYIGRLIVKTPGAAGIEDYCRIIREKHKCRRILEVSQRIARAATNGFLEESESLTHEISLIEKRFEPRQEVPALGPMDLMRYNTEVDVNNLLGQRWLCRGGSCLIVGPTGIGKSSLTTQACITWALGEPFFGIAPVRPLRSLVIQAENDVGDLAEMVKGVVNGTGYADRLDELGQNINFVSEAAVCGDAFPRWMRAQVLKYQPDLVWLDNLFSYAGCDVSDQGAMSKFLRNGLGAVQQETGCCTMIIHHTNKPKDEAKMFSSGASSEAYAGSGTADIINWARAGMLLSRNGNDTFTLTATKRGRRAGMIDHTGRRSERVIIQYGKRGGIYWEPIELQNDMELQGARAVLANMEGRPYSRTEVAEVVGKLQGVGTRSVIGNKNREPGRIYRRALTLLKHQQETDTFTKG